SAKVVRAGTSTSARLPLTSRAICIADAPLLSRLPGHAHQGALDQRPGEGPAIAGAGMDILRRIDLGPGRRDHAIDDGGVDPLTGERRLGGAQAARLAARAEDADMDVGRAANAVEVVEHGNPRHGKVAATAGHFVEAPAPPALPWRQAQR